MGFSNETTNMVLQKKIAALEEAFNLMALICAGSFAVIVSLRTEKPTSFILVSLIAMIVNVFSALVWHLSTFVSLNELARNLKTLPNQSHAGYITKVGVAALVIAVISFLVTYIFLLLSVV